MLNLQFINSINFILSNNYKKYLPELLLLIDGKKPFQPDQ